METIELEEIFDLIEASSNAVWEYKGKIRIESINKGILSTEMEDIYDLI